MGWVCLLSDFFFFSICTCLYNEFYFFLKERYIIKVDFNDEMIDP